MRNWEKKCDIDNERHEFYVVVKISVKKVEGKNYYEVSGFTVNIFIEIFKRKKLFEIV